MSSLIKINYGLISPLGTMLRKRPRCLFLNRNLYVMSKLAYPVQPIKLPSKTNATLSRIKEFLKWNLFGKSKLLRSSYMLYARCTDDVNVLEFFEEFQMPDTFFSWFLVTELHVWICQVRLSKEGEQGRFMRNKMMEAFWKDIDLRAKKMGEIDATTKKEGMNELLQHYQAALFSYDEGLLSDDTVLAGALWRNFFTYQCDSAICLEKLVHYVRLQLSHLEGISADDMMYNNSLSWIPLKQFKKN